MSNLFNDLEGLRIAMEIETRGKEFYRQAYEQAVKQEHKDLFLLLMNDEVDHYNTFKKIFTVLKERKEANSDDYLFDHESSRYLTVLAESQVFPREEQAQGMIAGLKTISAILETALQAEKDSILFYDELAKSAKFEDARKIFNTLKTEEQAHAVKIMEMINAWA